MPRIEMEAQGRCVFPDMPASLSSINANYMYYDPMEDEEMEDTDESEEDEDEEDGEDW